MTRIEHGKLYTLVEGWKPGFVPQIGRQATVSDLVAALREEGVGATMILDHDLPHGFEIIPNDVREPYMENGRYLVVRIDGEET